MLGSSRESLAACSTALDARRQAPGFDALAGQLYAVAAVLDDNAQLRSTLADSGQPASVRQSLVRDILGGKVDDLTLDVVAEAVERRWSDDVDLVIALEQLAAQASFTVAEADGTLDATEEEIFRFGRAVDASAALQMALGDPAQAPTTKAAIVRDLLQGRATAATRQVLESSVGRLHGQRLDAAIDTLCELAARQRDRVVAEVRVAAPLTEEQTRRLAAALSTLKGRTVRLNVAIDPSVMGGVHVTIGDEVIDGTIASRLEQARRAVLG
jgi:F-type H+-transporting ATPase subunit delta